MRITCWNLNELGLYTGGCCGSCHMDAEEGYDYPLIEINGKDLGFEDRPIRDEVFGELCCSVYRDVKERKNLLLECYYA